MKVFLLRTVYCPFLIILGELKIFTSQNKIEGFFKDHLFFDIQVAIIATSNTPLNIIIQYI